MPLFLVGARREHCRVPQPGLQREKGAFLVTVFLDPPETPKPSIQARPPTLRLEMIGLVLSSSGYAPAVRPTQSPTTPQRAAVSTNVRMNVAGGEQAWCSNVEHNHPA